PAQEEGAAADSYQVLRPESAAKRSVKEGDEEAAAESSVEEKEEAATKSSVEEGDEEAATESSVEEKEEAATERNPRRRKGRRRQLPSAQAGVCRQAQRRGGGRGGRR
ncbi:hypothetical protein PF007_g18439, partial [Phytophthora fragariae]